MYIDRVDQTDKGVSSLVISALASDSSKVTNLEIVPAHDLPVGLRSVGDVGLCLLVEDPLELDGRLALLARLSREVDLALLERGNDELVQPQRRSSIEERVLSVEARSARGEDNDCEW